MVFLLWHKTVSVCVREKGRQRLWFAGGGGSQRKHAVCIRHYYVTLEC